jgi:hypothetical protein
MKGELRMLYNQTEIGKLDQTKADGLVNVLKELFGEPGEWQCLFTQYRKSHPEEVGWSESHC